MKRKKKFDRESQRKRGGVIIIKGRRREKLIWTFDKFDKKKVSTGRASCRFARIEHNVGARNKGRGAHA